MATNRTRPPLTKKRQKWAEQRGGFTFEGRPLPIPLGVQARYQNALESMIEEMGEAVEKEIRSVFKENENPITEDASIASQARIALNNLTRRFQRRFNKKAKRLADQLTNSASKQSTSDLFQSLRDISGGLTLKTSIVPEEVEESVKASIAENVNLIKSIPAQYFDSIQGDVMRSIQPGGGGLSELLPKIQKRYGKTKRRARIIANDQTKKVYSNINSIRMQALGIKKFKWRHSGGGAEPRKLHVKMDGNIYSFDDLPVIDRETGERGLPGQLINCHPGDSIVNVANGCMKLYRRVYTGELLKFISDDGVILKATPNHPILTGRGWVKAKDIKLGDYFIKCTDERINISKADINDRITKFDQFFDSASRLIGKCGTDVSGAAFEFHGDISDSEVDVIDISRSLPGERNIEMIEKIRELILAYADSIFYAPPCDSASDEFIVASLLAPNGSVSGLCALLSKLRGEISGANDVCLGLSAYIDSAFCEMSINDGARNPVFLSNLKNAKPGGVLDYDFIVRQILSICALGSASWNSKTPTADSLGEIVRINTKLTSHSGQCFDSVENGNSVINKIICENFSGHVYNLETNNNWYSVNGIITHNCRCQMIPVIEAGDETDAA